MFHFNNPNSRDAFRLNKIIIDLHSTSFQTFRFEFLFNVLLVLKCFRTNVNVTAFMIKIAIA